MAGVGLLVGLAGPVVPYRNVWMPPGNGPWPPLVGLGLVVGAVASASGIAGLVRLRRRPVEAEAPAQAPQPAGEGADDGCGWGDVAVFTLLAIAGLAVQAVWAALANPEGILAGMDGPSYLGNVIAVRHGDWSLYNPDKHILHALLAAHLDADPLVACRRLSLLSVAALPPLGFALARVFGSRREALLVGLLCGLRPEPWSFSIQTTNYALFFAVVTLSLATLSAALVRPTAGRWALAGLAAGLCLATQEKAVLTVFPEVGVGLLFALPGAGWGGARRQLGGLAIAAVAAGGLLVAVAPPVTYTAFGSLIANQREEVHREMPWTWPVVRRPDPAHPTDPALPAALRGGDLEATLAALTTPADSDILRLDRPDAFHTVGFKVVDDTSIPPLTVRLANNLAAARRTIPTFAGTTVVLLGIGLLGLCLPGAGRGPARWLALAPAAALLSAWGPLSLKYNYRYLQHLVPVATMVGVLGLGRLLARLAGPSRPARLVVEIAQWAFWLLFALAVWMGNDGVWRRPTFVFPPPTAEIAVDPGDNALATLRVAQWLKEQPEPHPILDCAPDPVGLLLSDDGRVAPADGGARCRAAAADPLGDTWLVASNHTEFRDARTLDPTALVASGRWVVCGGWDPRSGAIPAGARRWSQSAVVVLAPTTPAPTPTTPAALTPAAPGR
jgi:hypothetical protein